MLIKAAQLDRDKASLVTLFSYIGGFAFCELLRWLGLRVFKLQEPGPLQWYLSPVIYMLPMLVVVWVLMARV